MLRRTLNLGILAHVDAGKTTLSERLLYAAGVIGTPGRVDAGTTQTDSLELERQRGITIRSAVVSLEFRGTSINLIDTPGHPDFVAEVDRVLGVLDGAVLVISAVEGVQPQTRVLMRALRRLRVPTLLFINKVDRMGADVERVLAEIRHRLATTAIPMWQTDEMLDVLADNSDALVAAYIRGAATPELLREELGAQTKRTLVHPVYAGSAMTGTGVEHLMEGLVNLLPAATGDPDGPPEGSIFKIERDANGEKIAYVRMYEGTLRIRERPHGDSRDKVTAIKVFENGHWMRQEAVRATEIGKLWGLAGIRVGDAIGRPRESAARGQPHETPARGRPRGTPARTQPHETPARGRPRETQARQHFALPTLEAVIDPVRPQDHVPLRTALAQLAEQDPLINVRLNGTHQAVSLYGEVQKEVIEATLSGDYGIEVTFRETTPLYIERPIGVGEALELLNADGNPFRATIGLRVEPAPPGSGVEFRARVDYRGVPLFVYRNQDDFAASMEQYVRRTLQEGLAGWPVEDCVVTMTKSNYSSPDGPPSTRGPLSTAADFRKLTPLVLMRALEIAGTAVCEPMSRVRVDGPITALASIVASLSRIAAQNVRGDDMTVEGTLPAADVIRLQRRLPALSNGEGVIESAHAGYQPLRGDRPQRTRTTVNPLNRVEYLAATL